MKLDGRRHVQATTPATPNQVGAIRRECERLGFTEAERAGRLAICAALAGLEQLGSTADLTMGQAGQLLRALLDLGDRDELRAAAGIADEHLGDEADEDQADEDEDRAEADEQPAGPTLAEAVKQLIIAYLIWQDIYDRRADVKARHKAAR